MIARLTVQRGSLTEYPLAEKVPGGWQNGVTFYPDAEVTGFTPLVVSVQGEPEWEYGSALVSDPDKASPLPNLQEANESVSAWNESVRRMDRQGRANSGPALVVRRRPAGPWVPVQAPEGEADEA